jgi:hypothetical protein
MQIDIGETLKNFRRIGTYEVPDPPLAEFQSCPRLAILELDLPSNLDDRGSFHYPLSDSGGDDTVAWGVDTLEFAYAGVCRFDSVVSNSRQLRACRAGIYDNYSIHQLAVE